MIRLWQVLTLTVVALGLTMGSAHVLEMPQKLGYNGAMYTAVNSTLYRYFAIVGGMYSIASIVTAAVLAYLMRGQGSAFSWALAGAVLVTLAFVAWLALVQPVNSEAGAVMKANPQALPAAWMRLRTRWEYGHAVAFGIHLLGFIALATAIVSSFAGRRA